MKPSVGEGQQQQASRQGHRQGAAASRRPRGRAGCPAGRAHPARAAGRRWRRSAAVVEAVRRRAVPGAPVASRPRARRAARPKKTLGGEQVEGRQAVRELLIAGKRRVQRGVGGSRSATTTRSSPTSSRSPRTSACPCRRGSQAARSRGAQRGAAGCHRLRRRRCPRPSSPTLLKRAPGRAPFLVAVDGVTDPGNLGALLRCCDGAGVHGVVLPRHRAVHVTPTVAKAAAGAVEHVPMAMVGGLPPALARIKDAGIWVVGLDDAADRDLFDIGDLAVEAHLPGARCRGCRPVAPGARALRHDRQHPDARPAVVAQRHRRRRAGHLRDRPGSALIPSGRPPATGASSRRVTFGPGETPRRGPKWRYGVCCSSQASRARVRSPAPPSG